ncbi:MAG: hypothetical protein LQ343_003264 [Gyalolechia ehrenbergii]|nr:MAG: hypothetical protein LQ343_003264 [Gyalolechia ehrenbergii]
MDSISSRPAGSSFDEAGGANSKRSARRSQLDQISSPVDSTPLSARNSALERLERYRDAVEHPGSAVAASAWRRSPRRFEILPDTPLQLQRPDSQHDQPPNQADAVLSAVSNNSVQAPVRSAVPRNFFAESQDTPSDHNGTDTSSSTQHLAEDVHIVSGTMPPAGRPEVARLSRDNSIHSPLSGFPPAAAADRIQKEDSTGNPTARRSLDPSTPPELQHDQQWSARQEHRKLSREGHDPRSDLQRTRTARREVRKPQLVSEDMFKLGTRKIISKEAFAELDKSMSAEAKMDPLLYNNIRDKLRQRTVDTWLLRSKTAFLIKNWGWMESYGRQAQRLASDLQWEPLVAQCAFFIGVALYKQECLDEAREYMEEAKKTHGYYISRTEISHWCKKIKAKLDVSARPQERARLSTPLTNTREDSLLPRAELETLESEILEDTHQSSHEVEASTEAPEIPVSSDAPKGRSSAAPPVEERHGPFSEGKLAAMQGPTPIRLIPSHYIDNPISNARHHQSLAPSTRHGLAATAVRLGNPVPASISRSRLYDPAHPLSPSSPLRGNSPQPRSGLIIPQTHPAPGLSEMVLPDSALPSPRSTMNGNRKSAYKASPSSQTIHVPIPPLQTTDPAYEQYLSDLHDRRQLHDLDVAITEAEIQKLKAVASSRVLSARSAGVSAVSPEWLRPWSLGLSVYAVRPKSNRGNILQKAVSEREIPRLKKRVVPPSPRRLRPGIK